MAERLQVLIIDDDAARRTDMRYRLGAAIEVQEADTGETGIALLKARKFDCTFVGDRLPDMAGTGVLQNFYDIGDDMMPTAFVMLGGDAGDTGMADALRWGAHDYILKEQASTPALATSLAKAREIFSLRKARHSAGEKLRHAQKMDAVGQLASGFGHDFNNLLTVILGNTRLIQRRVDAMHDIETRAAILPKIEGVEDAARRGANLIRQLMVFSRQSELSEQVVDLRQFVQAAVDQQQKKLGEDIKVRLLDTGTNPSVRIDAKLFDMALANIAANARDAMPQGGALDFAVGSANYGGKEYAHISVRDTGRGMPAHVLERIFEPFFTTKKTGEGTGLGLAMVYGFVRQSGGHIEAASTEGQGTTLDIYLPLYRSG